MAGCTENFQKSLSFLDGVKKKIKRLIFPWIVFVFLSLLLRVITEETSIENIKSCIGTILKGSVRNNFFVGSLWFLTALFVISIFFLIIKHLPKWAMLLVSFVMFLMTIPDVRNPLHVVTPPSWVFNVDSAMHYFVYYVIGFCSFFSINQLLSSENIKTKIATLASFIFSFLFCVATFFGANPYVKLYDIPYISIVATIPKTIIMVWFIICLSYKLQHIECLRNIGKQTLFLCGNEYIVSVLIPMVAGIFGLEVQFSSPMAIYLYGIFMIAIIIKILIPIEKTIFNI